MLKAKNKRVAWYEHTGRRVTTVIFLVEYNGSEICGRDPVVQSETGLLRPRALGSPRFVGSSAKNAPDFCSNPGPTPSLISEDGSSLGRLRIYQGM